MPEFVYSSKKRKKNEIDEKRTKKPNNCCFNLLLPHRAAHSFSYYKIVLFAFVHNMPNGNMPAYTHLRHQKPDESAMISIFYDCTFGKGGLPSASLWMPFLNELTSSRVRNNHQHWNEFKKWNPEVLLSMEGFILFSRRKELNKKAAARYAGLIQRLRPADLSWPGRLYPWLKGCSKLEVFGIDCSKLHHKPPCRWMFSLFHLIKGW